MNNWQSRTAMLLGEDSLRVLAHSKVAVIGLGGVGSYAVEALARAGIGSLVLIDGDDYSETNINRQLYALNSTVGMAKSAVCESRVKEINPSCSVMGIKAFVTPDNVGELGLESCNYVLDCIDSVGSKVALAEYCINKGIKIISAMGAGNKLHPEMFEISDISKTSVCPLAKAVRLGLRAKGINHLKVVYSKELPVRTFENGRVPASISFVPSAVGLIMAGDAVRDLLAGSARTPIRAKCC